MRLIWQANSQDSSGGAWIDADAAVATPPGAASVLPDDLPSLLTDSPSDLATTLSTAMTSGSLSMLDTTLARYVLGSVHAATAPSTTDDAGAMLAPTLGDGQSVTIDFTAKDGDGAALLASLQSLGLQGGASFGAVASGSLALDKIADLTSLPTLGFASVSQMYTAATASQGSVVTQADTAQRDDIARATYNVNGQGLKIGILSDSFNTSGNSDTMATDIASGDLPADTTILQDSPNGTDEGRAMAQLVHDIAPNASIEFATAEGGQAAFAANIVALANAGAKVIVDDVGYFEETAYQDGVIAQAIDQVEAMGVTYLSAASNDGHKGYEAPFTAGASPITFSYGGVTYTADQFAAGQTLIPVTLGSSERFILEWDQPAASAGNGSPGSASDLDLFLTDQNGNVLTYSDGTAIDSVDNNIGQDPTEDIGITGAQGLHAYLRIGLKSGAAPTDLKLIVEDNGAGATITQPGNNTNDGTVYGHQAAVGDIAVGAAAFYDTPAFGVSPPTVESFSSGGPTTVSFAEDGTRYTSPQIRPTPALTAVDGGNTTFFGTDTSHDADTLPNFFGTSAAAPDAAATALLMLQARSTLDPTDIKHLLMDSAIDMDDPATPGFDTGYDYGTGSGLIQADTAVGYASTLQFTADATHATLVGSHLSDTFVVANAGTHTLTGAGGNDVYAGTGTTLGGTTITDFNADDLIHFTDATLTGLSVSYAPGTGLLSFMDGSTSGTIGLPTGFSGNLTETADASGGVDVALSTALAVAITGVSGPSSIINHTVTGSVDVTSAPAAVGGTVTLSDAGSTIASATIQADGSWSTTIRFDGEGPTHTYALTATASDTAGDTGASTVTPYTVDTTPNQSSFGTVVHDPNSGAGQLDALYEAILGRAPDPSGWSTYLGQLDNGGSLGSVAQQILGSTEFTNRAGDVTQTSNATYVDYLYQTALGRAPDPDGDAFWNGRLAGGESRADVAVSFAVCDEHENDLAPTFSTGVFAPDETDAFVARLYDGVLGRTPELAGLNFWEGQARGGASALTLAQDFLSCDEYAGQHPTTPSNADFVNQLYTNTLGRPASDPGAQTYVADLTAGTLTRAQVVVDVASSPEALVHLAGQVESGYHVIGTPVMTNAA